MVRLSACLTISLLLFVGCNESPAPRDRAPLKDGNVNVVAPGVNVDVEPKGSAGSPGKVKVNAPGVQVDVGRK